MDEYVQNRWYKCINTQIFGYGLWKRHLHRLKSTYYTKTHKNPITEPTFWAKPKKCQLWPPQRVPSTHFFYETLHTSYWGIDEWIWILTLVKWPIWKNGHFSTGPPSTGLHPNIIGSIQDGQSILSVFFTCGLSQSHSCKGNLLSVVLRALSTD